MRRRTGAAVISEMDSPNPYHNPNPSQFPPHHPQPNPFPIQPYQPSGVSEAVSTELPEGGFLKPSARVLYNVNAAGHLGIITMTYGSVLGAPEFFQPLGHDQKLLTLPANVSGDIDEAFPDSVSGSR